MDKPSLPIPSHILKKCYQNAIENSPHEACGVLSGPIDVNAVEQFHPLENIINQLHQQDPKRWPRHSKNGYLIDPQALLKLENQLCRANQAIKVYVHSHVGVGAYFSQEDRQRASFNNQPINPCALYLVCAVKNKQPDGAILAWFSEFSQSFQTIAL